MKLIKNGTVYLGRGHYGSGWDVLCDGPIIRAVGPGLSAEGGDVIDAAGRHVYPGIVLGLCAVGAVSFSEMEAWDINEVSAPLVPQMDIRDAFDLRELKLQRFARAGVTSYGLSPGTQALLAGQISLIHTVGARTADVFLADRVALKGNYTDSVKRTFKAKGSLQTRMAMYRMLDEAFRGAQEYGKRKDKDIDAGKEVLCRVLRREIPLMIAAHTSLEIESVIRLGKKYGLRLAITGAFGVEPFAEEIMAEDWDVLLGDPTNMMSGLRNGTDLKKLVDLYRRGMRLSIFGSGDDAYPYGYEQVWWIAAQMSAAGATGEEIIDMMTVNPARALGVDHLVGAIKEGMMADLMICEGNPATRFDNYIDETIIGGETAYRREAE